MKIYHEDYKFKIVMFKREANGIPVFIRVSINKLLEKKLALY